MRCLGSPINIDNIEDPTPKPEPEIPEYVTQLREEIADLKDRVRSLEEANRHYHGGNSDDD